MLLSCSRSLPVCPSCLGEPETFFPIPPFSSAQPLAESRSDASPIALDVSISKKNDLAYSRALSIRFMIKKDLAYSREL